VDVLVELNRRFEEIVTEKLDFKSKEALITQRDLSTMSKAEAMRIITIAIILRTEYPKLFVATSGR
jgi:hypothetical protein